MTPEDIARRFEQRQGYELIDYAEVALPLYRLSIDAVTMFHREIPPIKEFVMRSIEAGLDDSKVVSGFLGLDEATVHTTFAQLESEKYATTPDGSSATLTERGREILKIARESSPRDEMLVFLYDRLLLKPIRLTFEQLMVPANIDAQRVVEIRPYPAEGPEISQLSLPEIAQVLEEQAGGREAFGRDLLRLKRIVRRVRLYRSGVALVYKKVRSSELQIAFIVDDARHEGLEHAFAVRGGPKKMGFVQSIDESATAGELRRYLGTEVVRLLPDSASFDEKRIAVSLARLRHQTAVSRAERVAGRVPELEASVEATASALKIAQSDLEAFSARPVSPYELPELLGEALQTCEQKLIVSSRTIDRSIVDSQFLKRLTEVLDRGVNVSVSLSEATQAAPALEMEKLRSRYPRLSLSSNKRGQFHHLVCDNRFAVVSNRPFLGNLKKVRTFHYVVGYILQESSLVDAFIRRTRSSSDAGLQQLNG